MSDSYATFKANPGNIWGTDNPAPFNAVIKYRTNHPPEALESENYFLPIRSAFRRHTEKPGMNPYQAGDKIEATCFQDDGTWKEATFEVYYVDEFCVKVERLTDWRQSRHPESTMDKMTAKHVGFGKWSVFYANGKPFRQGIAKEEAERLVGHPLGKQVESEAADAAE